MHALCDYSQVGVITIILSCIDVEPICCFSEFDKETFAIDFFYPFSVVTCELCSRTAHVYI